MTPEPTSANGETYTQAQARRRATEAKNRAYVPPPDNGRRAEPVRWSVDWTLVFWAIVTLLVVVVTAPIVISIINAADKVTK